MRQPWPFPVKFVPPATMPIKTQWEISHEAMRLIEDLTQEWADEQQQPDELSSGRILGCCDCPTCGSEWDDCGHECGC